MNKFVRAAAVIAIAALVGGIAYYAFQQAETRNGKLSASGTIEATEIDISAQTAARILSIGVTEGDVVKKGRLIARLDNSLLMDQVRQARAGVTAAWAAVRETRSEGSKADLAAARAQMSQARAAYSMALTQLSYTKVRSPISGVVLSVPANAGENAAPGSTLAVVADLNRVHVHVYIPETQLGRIKLGRQATVVVDSFPGRAFQGEVSAVASEPEFTPANIETKEQRVKMVFEVTVSAPNKDRALKPGMPADVTFR